MMGQEAVRDMNVEELPVGELVPYERNTKLHPMVQVSQIVESIREFGFNDPIAIDDASKVIIEGHGRLLAAKKLSMKTVPVIRINHLSDEQRRAYAIAHNKLNLLTGFDRDLLKEEMLDLKGMDFDLSLTGFIDFELKNLLPKEEQGQGGGDRRRDLIRLPFAFLAADRKAVLDAASLAQANFGLDTPMLGLMKVCDLFLERMKNGT